MTKMPTTGAMRDRVIFTAPILTADDTGGNVRTWDDDNAITVWGHYNPSVRKGVGETLNAGALETKTQGRLTIRKSSETSVITHEWKVTIDGQPLNIRSVVQPDRRGRFIEMEITGGGNSV